jgi:hypothetical protein
MQTRSSRSILIADGTDSPSATEEWDAKKEAEAKMKVEVEKRSKKKKKASA